MGNIVCPKCKKDDQIQKVTSIVTNGVSTTNYRVENAYGSGSGTSVSQTQLASRLSPPAKPKPSIEPSCANVIGIVFSGVVVGVIFQSIARVDLLTSVTPFIAGFFVGFVGLIVYINYDSQNAKKKIPNWEKQLSNWRELYYCYRDDCIFDPRTEKYSSPAGMNRLIE